MKTYHFLAGLPRSGNTLLSSILNQNPDIYSSPLSPVCNYLWDLERSITSRENNARTNYKKQNASVMAGVLDNFYYNVDKPIVIDREKSWGTPGNLNLLKTYIAPQPKIIFTVRSIVEILASFIALLPENTFTYIDEDMAANNWWYKNFLSRNDNRCEYLMRPYGMIDQVLLSFNEIHKPENAKSFCLVEYNDLVEQPETIMRKIYNFLELDYFEHDFNNIQKLEHDKDPLLGLPNKLHHIRPKLNKQSLAPEKILSEYIIEKYSNIKFVRHENDK